MTHWYGLCLCLERWILDLTDRVLLGWLGLLAKPYWLDHLTVCRSLGIEDGLHRYCGG